MLIEVYVNWLQLADFGYTLRVGDRLTVDLLGNPGSTIDVAVPDLDVYMSDQGRRALRKTGIAEYAFSGQILEVQSIRDHGGKGLTYREVLLDCGVPIVLVTHGSEGFGPLDINDPKNKQIRPERYMSGLMMLQAMISFREPALIERKLEARICSITALDFSPSSLEIPGSQRRDSIDTVSNIFPAVLEIEI